MKVIAQVVLAVVVYAIFVVLIAMSGIDLALSMLLWDKVPAGMNMRVFAWNGLLIINVLCTAFIAGLTMFLALLGGKIQFSFVEKK